MPSTQTVGVTNFTFSGQKSRPDEELVCSKQVEDSIIETNKGCSFSYI
jgi:hypothetical protein